MCSSVWMSYDFLYDDNDDDLDYYDTWTQPYIKRHPGWIPPPRDPILRSLDRRFLDRRRDEPPPHRCESSSQRRYASPVRRQYASPPRRPAHGSYDSMSQRRKPAPTSVRHEQVVVPVWAEAMRTRLDTCMQRCQDLLTARSCKLIPVPAEVQSKPPVRATIISKAPSSVIEVAAKPDLETGTFQSQGEEYDVTPPSRGSVDSREGCDPAKPSRG